MCSKSDLSPSLLFSVYAALIALSTSLYSGSAYAQEGQQRVKAEDTKVSAGASEVTTARTKSKERVRYSLSGRLLTQAHWRNDSDFDLSERYDDLDGQTDSQIASFFDPMLTAQVGREVTICYQLELGWNAWSRNDPGQPNQFFTMRTPGLLARHKRAWGQWSGDGIRIRAGFQRVRDPSGLFLDHTIGAVTTRFNLNKSAKRRQHITLLAGQIPDTTIEGFDIRNDNLVTDSFIFGLKHLKAFSPKLTLRSGLYYLADRRAINRPLDLGVASLSLRLDRKRLSVRADLVGQYGVWANSAIAGRDARVMSWAAQLGFTQTRGKLSWGLNAFALSPDDDVNGNDRMGAFLGSARNRSSSVFLTEDETRDRYDNLDERLGSYWGALSFSPAGLLVSDASLGYQLSRDYNARAVIATGSTLNPSRTLGERYVGTELSILQTMTLGENARIKLNLLLFLPGGAGAAMINDINRSARHALFGGSLAFGVNF